MALGILTEYAINHRKYASYVLTSDFSEARRIVDIRGIGETIVGESEDIELVPDFTRISDGVFLDQILEVLHLGCFFSFVAASGRYLSVSGILGDEGIVHEIVHLMGDKGNKMLLKKVRGLYGKLQESMVGYY